jgi:hypothetical protein
MQECGGRCLEVSHTWGVSSLTATATVIALSMAMEVLWTP